MRIPKTIWLFIFIIIAIPVMIWHTVDHMSQLEPQTYMANMNPRRTNRFSIAVVGDEWARDAHDNGFDNVLRKATGAAVTSSGQRGETTKALYHDLACDRFEWVIEGRPTYAVLMIGLNDQRNQHGPDQYAYHIRKIVDLLTYYDIRPVVVGIPRYDIERYYGEMNGFKRLYYHYLSIVGTGEPDFDNLKIYRDILAPDTLPANTIYIPEEEMGLQDSACWASPVTLTSKGYSQLATAIAKHVSRHGKK